MLFSLSIPSKTFLLGEYITLVGGPALVLNTEPRFQLQVDYQTPSKKVIVHGISTTSPAGKFIAHHAKQFKGYTLTFIDPHQTQGGFGASSAQFALVSMLVKFLLKMPTMKKLRNDFIHEDILPSYQQFAWNGVGIKPSGADVVTQLQGQLAYYHRAKNKIESFVWPFAQYDFCLLRTGHKVATHLHLKQLSAATNRQWSKIALAGLQSLKQKNTRGFAQAIRAYAQAMQQQNLVTPQTQNLLRLIAARDEVLAAKGCGALGADVIFVMLEKKRGRYFQTWAQKQGLDVVFLGNQVSEGFCINLPPARGKARMGVN